MLEALAKARRAQFGDDPKMPNPMRARLHEEIARVGAADDEQVESRSSWITMFWPRVTVAAALATLIVLVPAILWNRSHPLTESSDLAIRDRAAAASNGPNAAVHAENTLAKPPAVSVTQSTVNLADNSQIKVEPPTKPASEAEALASSTHVTQGRAATELSRQVTKDEFASANIQSAPAAARKVGADSKTKSDAIAAAAPPVAQPSSAGSLGMTQQFSQQAGIQSFRNTAQLSQSTNVLNTFQVEQQGNEIRVLDADGSTYTGQIEQLAKNAELDSRMTARPDAAKQRRSYAAKAVPKTESVAPQWSFRAMGFNVSLKKTVVFEGNYVAPPAQQPVKTTSNNGERSEQSRDRARIVGTVRVNGEAAVEVDAIAETPEPTETKKSDR